ncbi:PQQ-binding-like beta-propeller repeat protein [Candidatus Sumerlaeota bacterium]|nr:PQQ-binding-like beta-propeller repeat protein [Candidatus Sumerlaeota bacterium]
MSLLSMVVLGVFAVAMLSVLTSVHFRERRAGILADNELQRLKKEQVLAPDNAELKERIRDLDQGMRTDYYTNRRRFLWAGYILLATAVAWILAARRVFAPPAARTVPERRSRPTDGGRATWVLAVSGGILSLVLVYAGVAWRPALPPAGWTSDVEARQFGAAIPRGAESAVEPNWPCFRGPGNIGLAADGDWPTTWSVATNRNILWKTPVPAEGKSSPVVWGNRIFLTGGTATEHRVVCFDRSTGELLWNSRVTGIDLSDREIAVMEDTGFAASTPTTDGERVYAIFATGIAAAFDFDGRQAWVRDLGAPESMYGFAASLLFAEGAVVLQFDQGADADEGLSKLVGLSPDRGEVVWSIPRPVPNSWSSPALIPAPGGVQLIACGAPWVIAYDLKNRREVWRAEGLDGDVAPSPAFGGGMLFVTNDGADLLAIRPDGAGNVTDSHIAWRADLGVPDISSPVSNGRRVLQSAAGGLLTCFDAAKGELVWEKHLESSASSSPIVAGERVYLTGIDGVTRIFDMDGDAYHERGHGEIGEAAYATPAFVESRIYIRGANNLIAVGKTP